MKIIYVDDERSAFVNFSFNIKNRNDIASLQYFTDYDSAISYAKGNEVNCAFLDIELPGKNGIELGLALKSLNPNIEIVFITSYDEFAREAYKVGGRGYLTKPYTYEELDEIINRVGKLVHTPVYTPTTTPPPREYHIFAKTFGMFDLVVDGKPLHFKNAKAKELLAFLINLLGGTASNAQIFFALWEKQEYTRSTSTYVRRTIRSLKEELENYGIEDILVTKRNSVCIDASKIECDYFNLLQGSAYALQQYNGKYMSQYSWGEETIPVIERTAKLIENSSSTPPPFFKNNYDLKSKLY